MRKYLDPSRIPPTTAFCVGVAAAGGGPGWREGRPVKAHRARALCARTQRSYTRRSHTGVETPNQRPHQKPKVGRVGRKLS